jgi:protein O-mannosyl-transferase
MRALRSAQKKRPARSGALTAADSSQQYIWFAGAALVLLGALVYANSLSGAFVTDDYVSIVENPDIRRVWSLDGILSRSGESPLIGRPLVTWTFAVNYAIGGLNVTGYHLVNIALHLLCSLVLFGLVRRLSQSVLVAFACASLWMLHPLNTEAVDYLTQRTELMMGLFYLLTLYTSVRAHAARWTNRWLVASVVASGLGMACKQSMVTVPIAVVLVDRVFFFDSLTAACRARWCYYAALTASTGVAVIFLLVGPRLNSIGLSSGVSPWIYLLNQSRMITRYLALTAWPRHLVANYGHPQALALADVGPQMMFIAALLALTAITWRRRPAVAFLGAWFFVTLAVTSSVLPIATEVGAERRMYLPLMALVVLAVACVTWLVDRITLTSFPRSARAAVMVGLWVLVAVPLAAGTVSRNQEYSSALQLAQTVVDRWPTGQSRHVLATELLKAGRRDEAYVYAREAVRDDARAHYTLGVMLFQDGRLPQAREQLEQFVRQEPLLAEAVNARSLIGRTLFAEGQLDAAAQQFALAASMQPSFPDAHLGLGEVRFAQRRFDAALAEYRTFLTLKSGSAGNAGVWQNVGIALRQTGHRDDAIDAWRRAAVLDPGSALPHRSLAAALLERGDVNEAAEHAARAVALRPQDATSHDLLGVALLAQQKVSDAVSEFQQSLRLNPGDSDVQAHLRQALGAR